MEDFNCDEMIDRAVYGDVIVGYLPNIDCGPKGLIHQSQIHPTTFYFTKESFTYYYKITI